MTQAAFPMSQKFSIIAHDNVNNLPAQDDKIKDGIFLYAPLPLLITFWRGLLSFYVAALLKSKRKEKERPGCGPELSFWRLPPPLGRASGEAPGEAGQGHQCNQGPNKHQLASNHCRHKHQGSGPGAVLKQKLLQHDTECMQVATVLVPESRKRDWNMACESLKPASLIHIKSLSNLFWNKEKKI